ncbi:MAG: hypothetical protein ACI35O_03970 [Bacillaceae bacterium]
MVHIVHVRQGETFQLAGVFAELKDAYGYLTNNKLIGTVNSMEIIVKSRKGC